MYGQIVKRIYCYLVGHRWNWVDADDEPDLGATCFRCGKINQKR